MSSYGPSTVTYRRSLEYPWSCDFTRGYHVDIQRRLDWIPSFDDIKNDSGCIRWHKIRSLYFAGLIDIDFCVRAYRSWRDTREDLWLDAVSKDGSVMDSIFVVAAKRGNKWYKERISKKFDFFEKLPPVHFFCDNWGSKQSPMLFITLSVDPDIVGLDANIAWNKISRSLNVFETKLRQKYGKFVKFRAWEAHESGFPHAHCLYYFLDHDFELWDHFDKKKGLYTGNKTFRVSDKDRDIIQSFWDLAHPFKTMADGVKRVPSVDIQGVSDTLGALSEVHKYVSKNIWTTKGDITNTLCSLHNKQAYSFSQCDYVKARDRDPGYSKLKDRDASIKERGDYLRSQVGSWARKDFIGAIWGPELYVDFYKELHDKGFSEGLREPGIGALVKETLHNYNIDNLEFSHFEFKGCFLHSDLVKLLNVRDDSWQCVDPPDEEIRLLLGVDNVLISFNAKSSCRFMEDDTYG